tara:strand:- start:9740 stop:10096 length:357 start_codon:yes stop_codon:yes gene_type:complete
MKTVKATAINLDDGIKNMMLAAKEDYSEMGTSDYYKQQTLEWDSKTKILDGKKYIKVVQNGGVFCFVCKADFKHFKKGDILFPASYKAPSLNQARGNVLDGNYSINWTGPLSLTGGLL